MDLLFRDENESCQIAFNNVEWATDKLNQIFDAAKAHILCDVDVIIETQDELLFIEYKNANVKNAKYPDAFNPLEDKSINKVARKYYDSEAFLQAVGFSKGKRKSYIYIMEAMNGDCVLRGRVRNRLKSLLPFLLQEQNQMPVHLIDDVQVVSIDGWNKMYPKFPALVL